MLLPLGAPEPRAWRRVPGRPDRFRRSRRRAWRPRTSLRADPTSKRLGRPSACGHSCARPSARMNTTTRPIASRLAKPCFLGRHETGQALHDGLAVLRRRRPGRSDGLVTGANAGAVAESHAELLPRSRTGTSRRCRRPRRDRSCSLRPHDDRCRARPTSLRKWRTGCPGQEDGAGGRGRRGSRSRSVARGSQAGRRTDSPSGAARTLLDLPIATSTS